MTIDELVARAHRILREPETSLAEVRELARGVSDLLASGDTCGWERPTADITDRTVDVPTSWSGARVATDDARVMARMLLRSSDEADAL